MKKFLILLVLVSACLSQPEIRKACFSEHCFHLEVADEDPERHRGLMYRDSLDLDSGMLFVFPKPGLYSFWMKNTRIPLDIIWVDENLSVVYIKHDALPCNQTPCPTFAPSEDALYVLEVNSGLARKMGLSEGDNVSYYPSSP